MHWRDIDEIAVQLEEHCNEHYENITLSKMEKLIRELADFEDVEEDVEEVTLEEILEKWGEIHEEHDDD